MVTLTSLRHAFPENAGFEMRRRHGHKDYTFLHFFNSIEIMQDGQIIQTAPHSVILFKPGTPQYFRSNIPLTHDWIHFTGDIAELLMQNHLEPDKLYYPTQTHFITELTCELESEFYGALQNSDQLIQYKFNELLIKLGRAVSEKAAPDIKFATKEKFRELRGKMFTHLNENWTLSRMAYELGYSESHFSNTYKAIYGLSPMADLIRARIDTAENMLTFGDKKIDEIAESLGYLNTTHFIRQFKERAGVSPAVYRKEHK